ncbi:MAG: outer membrane beta-barrel domain-containing protein [Proteobacteria bacterium]|nr:outer membrane beta-barrel domain-containing protein [Pseudomonadota bacterium]
MKCHSILILISLFFAASARTEEVDVTKIKEKYWAQGQDSELGVVQNRRFASEGHWELDLFTGSLSMDPFYSVSRLGASLGYHLSPTLSLHAIGWKSSATDSDAYRQLRVEAPNADLYRNAPKGFYGLQANAELLYGKAALFGKTILYVDLFALAGAGMTLTESGAYLTPFVGIGQKIRLTDFALLHLDYRVMRYDETVRNSTGATRSRTNWSDALTLGVGILF